MNLIVTKLIYHYFPKCDSGVLSDIREKIICNTTLGGLALKLNLGKYLIIGKAEEMIHIRTHQKTLADVIEALTAVVYYDSNKDFNLTQKVVLQLLKNVMVDIFIQRHCICIKNK